MHTPPQQTPGWPVALCLLVYAVLLYGQAATASLYDDYWPGIERLRWLASPEWLLLILLGWAWVSRSACWARIARRVVAGAWILCVLLFILLMLDPSPPTRSTWQFPHERSLSSVLHTAFFTPSFSNRSLIQTSGSTLWATLLWVIARLLRPGSRA